MIWISGISFLTCCLLMASWLPHNKFAVAAEPVSAERNLLTLRKPGIQEMIWISGISFLACCFLMASWLPHNKIVVAAGPMK